MGRNKKPQVTVFPHIVVEEADRQAEHQAALIQVAATLWMIA
jgi:hypothetical protein